MNQAELKKILNKQGQRPKYGNHKVCCLSKHNHDSKLEANYCNRLLAMKQKREIISYDVQVPIELNVNGVLVCKHIVDFMIQFPNKSPFIPLPYQTECHDTKGVKTKDWVIKHKLFKALYPDIKYVVVTAH